MEILLVRAKEKRVDQLKVAHNNWRMTQWPESERPRERATHITTGHRVTEWGGEPPPALIHRPSRSSVRTLTLKSSQKNKNKKKQKKPLIYLFINQFSSRRERMSERRLEAERCNEYLALPQIALSHCPALKLRAKSYKLTNFLNFKQQLAIAYQWSWCAWFRYCISQDYRGITLPKSVFFTIC